MRGPAVPTAFLLETSLPAMQEVQATLLDREAPGGAPGIGGKSVGHLPQQSLQMMSTPVAI